ncbi:dihydropteroate synthase [Sulfurospirillum diekertiae]|uniref:dihydropteroate synthase n=1 Tax=Sulfurospirillum diekertiae TaxID=1854492 RepID=A0A1Y0HLK7_9BACT|nr:dihydropteroate synthase [Sulfurospirillum diekertiae]ARU48978.1 Bifunctional dihydropteroate synthase/dihydropteroate reductase [Sulfurospirillum diekertiae]ASC93797.1 Bifunctional dihydropteroate synthase/dihydropteroate reductase [Sulfurospirillum diekertiae]
MKLYKLSSQMDAKALLQTVGVTHEGSALLIPKTHLNLIYIKDLKTPAANILKQDALSIGADLAVPKDTITCKVPLVDAVLIANDKQLKELAHKEKIQPFGLKEVAQKLSEFTFTCKDDFSVMGIINTNEDSFFQGSRFKDEAALKHVEHMIEEGATMIDLGGVSSRPGSIGVSEQEELSRVKPIIDLIFKHKLFEKAQFSLDSYSPLCLEYALTHGFSIVNDITALANDDVARVTAKYDATVILMHMQGDPKSMQHEPVYDNVMLEVDAFFEERIAKALHFGIKKIVLDVGIGFGKNLEHNLQLLKHHEHFLHFGYPLLIGASRKSMIDKIISTPIDERLPGTLALHLKAYEHGASIIRAHDVKAHVQALSVLQALNQTTI